MDALRAINSNLEECLNLAISSTSNPTISFPQQGTPCSSNYTLISLFGALFAILTHIFDVIGMALALKDRVRVILESAKQLELWLVEETHRRKFSPVQNELEVLRTEVTELRASHELKSETLGKMLEQVQDWMKQLEMLQARQLRAMFDLAPPPKDQSSLSDAQNNRNTISTDDMWWGQQATDESEDL